LPKLDKRRPQVLAHHAQASRTVLRRDVVSERHALERAHDALKVERRDHVLVAVTNERRQDLAIARGIAEMTDGFANQVRCVPLNISALNPCERDAASLLAPARGRQRSLGGNGRTPPCEISAITIHLRL